METTLNMWGEDRVLKFTKESYVNNGRLAIEVWSEDKEYGGYEPWCSLTVNLDSSIPNGNYAYLDTNNCSREIVDWLFDNDYVRIVGYGMSGYCSYPLVEFSDEFMKGI